MRVTFVVAVDASAAVDEPLVLHQRRGWTRNPLAGLDPVRARGGVGKIGVVTSVGRDEWDYMTADGDRSGPTRPRMARDLSVGCGTLT